MSIVFTSNQDGSTDIDNHMVDVAANSNYGTDTSFIVGYRSDAQIRRGLIKFDLSLIPAYAIVDSAVLSIWMASEESSNATTMSVYRLKRAWTETGSTWNKYDGTNSWQTAGAAGANDCEAASIGSCSLSATEAAGEKQWSLTPSKVQEWISGAFTNNGLLVKAESEANSSQYTFRSSEYATAGNRPKLVITYHLSGGRKSFII